MRDLQLGTWSITYDRWAPTEQPLREALCTLGNGLLATRGAAEERSAGGPHYPGTYVAGGYDRRETRVAGRWIENEDLVNWPNWLPLSFRALPTSGAAASDWLDLDQQTLLDFRQTLDLRAGVLERIVRLRDVAGRETELVSRRIVHMGDPHLAAIEWVLTPLDWSGPVEIRSSLDANVINAGVARYRELEGRHLELVDVGADGEDVVHLTVQTLQSHLRMTQAARTRIFVDGEAAVVTRRALGDAAVAGQVLACEVREGHPIRVEKIVAIHTGRDRAIADPRTAALEAARRAPTFADLAASHAQAWERLWRRCDLEIADTLAEQQTILRLHVFHLLQSVSPHAIDLDVGVTARGLHGEAYRGHVFWDELFIFPMLVLRVPEITRSLLMYRYRRLPAARRLAREAGYAGAMYPWQSGSDGREESQKVHLNPRSGRWVPDETNLQRHVSGAIAYNVWQYVEATGDREFLSFYGAEMLLEIARFWASLAAYDASDGRYHIRGVVGPDEFHTRYPAAESPGIDDNAYTNVLAAWVLRTARRAVSELAPDRRSELFAQIALDDDELARWDDVATKMFVPHLETGLVAQFRGYGELQELDWIAYRARYGDIHRIDRILESEGDTPNRYKASKQADVLMLFYLFSGDELARLFTSMGYAFDVARIEEHVDYYTHRTSDGSTLSRVVHAWVLSRSNRPRSFALFEHALRSDLEDVQGGTTAEGIHLGAMAGTVDMIQRCYTGIELRDGALWLDPRLPVGLDRIRLRVRHRGHWLDLHVSRDRLRIDCREGFSAAMRVGVRGILHTLPVGSTTELSLEDGPGGSGAEEGIR